MIEVVCGLIFKGDKIFICRRNHEKHLAGYWEFPGGKIESKESPEAALKRELKEELDMEIDEIKYFHTSIHKYQNFDIRLSAYTCTFVKSSFKMTDHDQFEWLDLTELNGMKLAPADLPIAEKLLTDSIGQHT